LRQATKERRTTTPPGVRKSSKPSPLVNGSFELNDGLGSNVFTGWTVVDLAGSSGSWFVQSGNASPLTGFVVQPPTDGSFAAMTDQFNPGSHILYQDVLVPSHGPAYLGFDLFLHNLAGAFATPNTLSPEEFPNQQFRADILNPNASVDDVGAGVLLPVYRTEVGDSALSSYRTITVSLQQFRGQVVRIRFAEVDNQGFFQVGLDRVTVGKRSKALPKEKIRDQATATLIPFAPEPGPFANVLGLGDDETTGPLPIGFEFTFFGNQYTQFFLSSNGFMGFDPDIPNGCCDGGVIPSDDGLNNLIALAWTDLFLPAGGEIAYETRGTAPNRRLIVSYTNVPLFGESATVTTQVILYEKKDVIEIHTAHQDLAVDHVYTQGIENADGTVAAFIPGRVDANYSLTNDAVRFTTKSPGPSAPGREANRPILWSENGHYYLLVEQTLTWQQARDSADAMKFKGVHGHLATITSSAENAFISTQLGTTQFAWLGGEQPPGSLEPDGGWQWITGEPWVYTNWDIGEPNNDYQGDFGKEPNHQSEERLHFKTDGAHWNDLPNDPEIVTPRFVVEWDAHGGH
jgi:hypothetical protein